MCTPGASEGPREPPPAPLLRVKVPGSRILAHHPPSPMRCPGKAMKRTRFAFPICLHQEEPSSLRRSVLSISKHGIPSRLVHLAQEFILQDILTSIPIPSHQWILHLPLNCPRNMDQVPRCQRLVLATWGSTQVNPTLISPPRCLHQEEEVSREHQ